MSDTSDGLKASIFNSMNEKSTEELTQIWQQHDTDEWTPAALEAARSILMARLGTLPQQAIDDFEDEDEEDVDLYHDPERSLKVAGWSNTLAWAVLSVYSLFALGLLLFIQYQTRGSSLVVGLISAVFVLVFGGVLFALLQALGEIILLLMDIEENTRTNPAAQVTK